MVFKEKINKEIILKSILVMFLILCFSFSLSACSLHISNIKKTNEINNSIYGQIPSIEHSIGMTLISIILFLSFFYLISIFIFLYFKNINKIYFILALNIIIIIFIFVNSESMKIFVKDILPLDGKAEPVFYNFLDIIFLIFAFSFIFYLFYLITFENFNQNELEEEKTKEIIENLKLQDENLKKEEIIKELEETQDKKEINVIKKTKNVSKTDKKE